MTSRFATSCRAGGLVLGLLVGLASAPAGAQDEVDVARAKVLFIEGVELFKEGQHAQALGKFQESHSLRPHWRIHLNIGLCFKELSMFTKAKASFDAFIAEGKDEIQGSERKLVKTELEKLKKIIAVLEIRIVTEGALVELDGKNVVEAAGAGPVSVDPGSHVIKASLEGYEPYREEFLVSKAEHRTFEIDLEPLSQGGEAAPVEAVPRSKGGAAFWVMGGLTLALAAGAVATGVVALQKHDDVVALDDGTGDLFDSGGYSDAAYQDYLDERRPIAGSGRRLGYATTAFMIAAGAALVGTIVAGVLTHPFSTEKDAGAASVQISPVPLEHGGMLVVSGPF
ncbi:MAG: PEGA domain-containing protein [Deltaproteobacteria bacterium]|nr:PEGA domain-containing protein [Deltaproteobacteria bacterium]